MRVGDGQPVAVGESLQTSPLARRHFADKVPVDFPADICHGSKVREPRVDNEVSLAPHTAADKRAREIVKASNLIAEPVTFRLVAFFMPDERAQILIREIIFRRDLLRLYDVLDAGGVVRPLRKGKVCRVRLVAKRDDINALTVLRYAEVLAVEHFIENTIAEFFKNAPNHAKRATAIMIHKVFDIFTENDARSVQPRNPRHIKKKRPPRILKSSPFPRERECLTRKAREQNIVRRHILFAYFRQIAPDCKIVPEIFSISDLRLLVPLADKHRLYIFSKSLVKAQSYPADAGKEINRPIHTAPPGGLFKPRSVKCFSILSQTGCPGKSTCVFRTYAIVTLPLPASSLHEPTLFLLTILTSCDRTGFFPVMTMGGKRAKA